MILYFQLSVFLLILFEGAENKTVITHVLKEDPKLVYLRQKWGRHCYVFRIAELYLSGKFN